METAYIIAINGLVAALFSFIAYRQSNKKNRKDYLNNQLSTIETKIGDIRKSTYELYKDIFIDNISLDENMSYRELNIEINDLNNQILANKEFKNLQEIMVEYNIFTGNVIEASDKTTSLSLLDDFDIIYTDFKIQINSLKEKINQ